MTNNRQIKIIAVEALSYPNELDVESKNIADHIHKSINKEKLYYLYRGYDIEFDSRSKLISEISVNEDITTPLSFYNINEVTTVNICSIVGVNGSGKSSIIELIIRIINNFAATIIGEEQNKPSAVHLHFIEHLYGRIICLVDNIIIVVSVEGPKVTYTEYQKRDECIDKWCISSSSTLHDVNYPNSIIKPQTDYFKYLKSFFYTIICNYSLYAYNVNDYTFELSNEEKVKKIREKEKISHKVLSNEDLCWLKGLFHKNDSYQTPIVITPFRGDGFVNVTRENSLARERLISLLLYREKKSENIYSYPLRFINDSLEADALYLTPLDDKKHKKERILKTLELKRRIPAKRFDEVYDYIKEYWISKYSITLNSHDPIDNDAVSYLVYKTLKIFRNYVQYNTALKLLAKKKDYNIESVRLYLNRLFEDLSHITNKLRQTITFLKFRHYYNSVGSHICKLDAFAENVYKLLKDKKGNYNWRLIDFLPSPIFKIEIQLYDTKIDKEKKTVIPFLSLSAGERQITYTISSLLYHLININSVWDNNLLSSANDINKDKGKIEIKYEYVNIILDEVELYFHPELQRKFISKILNGLKCVNISHLKGIQILMITHSPFVLSDIPSSNILFLKRGCKMDTSSDIKTFAANIHEMLSHNFFMESTIGKYAEEQIKQIIELYNQYKTGSFDWKTDYEDKKKHFQFVLNQIGEEYLKKMLNNMLLELDEHSQSKSYIEQLIKQKEKEIISLKNRLNDKN